MYQSLLTRKYLTSKIMPLLAAVAVTLCVATELIVWSVMGGFLEKFKNAGRSLIGDVAITWPNVGFPHADELIRRLVAEKDIVESAAATIETAGLISFEDGRIETVLVKGIDGPSYERVTDYAQSLWWRPLSTPMRKDTERQDPRLMPENTGRLTRALEEGRQLTVGGGGVGGAGEGAGGEDRPAVVLGIEVVSKRGLRAPGGWIWVNGFVPDQKVTLSVMPIDRRGRTVDVVARVFPVANEFYSGLFELDANTVLVRLDALQAMLKMDEAQRIEAVGGGGLLTPGIDPRTQEETFALPTVVGVDPARVTSVLVRARPGVEAELLRERCVAVYERFAQAHPDVPAADLIRPYISTWKDRNRTLISAVEKETLLVMFIFGIISLTAVFLVLAIFWSMVSEKTRDIGVLRALGAGRIGVAWIWVRYGLAIGIVGAIFGGIAAQLVVTNINEIHDWLGQAGRRAGRLFGQEWNWLIWDPSVYYFSEIPNQLEWFWKGVIVTVGGVAASTAGALIPAIKAARMDPVRALRWE